MFVQHPFAKKFFTLISQIKIYEHFYTRASALMKNKKNGTTYVYESYNYWDKEKKQSRSRRKCLGKLDTKTGELVPSKQFNSEPPRETKPGPVPVTETKHSFYGATYLLDQIGEKTGLTEDLKKCFPNTYKKLLSIAYFLILEDNNPLYRFSKWAATHRHPYGKDIPSQRSSEIFSSISEEERETFFGCKAGGVQNMNTGLTTSRHCQHTQSVLSRHDTGTTRKTTYWSRSTLPCFSERSLACRSITGNYQATFLM